MFKHHIDSVRSVLCIKYVLEEKFSGRLARRILIGKYESYLRNL